MNRKKCLIKGMLLLLCSVGGMSRGISAEAVFHEEEAVHVSCGEVEEATLAIGTHLIYLDAMNDSLYELAVKSAQESGQQEVYYKSELGDGAWYKTGGAVSLEAILPGGNKVDEGTVQALFFTHHTRSDGVTYDLRTGQAVSVFDIESPYDLETLPELEALRNQLEAMKESEADTGLLDAFFRQEEAEENEEEKAAREARESAMQLCDRRLSWLKAYSLKIAEEGETPSVRDSVLQVMKKVDASRRYESYTGIKLKMERLMDEVSASSELSGNASLQEALGTCLQELQSRLDSLEGERLEEGETAMSKVEYELIRKLMSAADTDTGTETDTDTEQAGGADPDSIFDTLTVLYYIQDGIAVEAERGKAFLDEYLLPKAKMLYEASGDRAAENEWKYYKALREQLDGEEPGNQELLELQEEAGKLQMQWLRALDGENLPEAEKWKQELADTVSRIQQLEREGIYGEGSMTEIIREQKEAATELIEEREGIVNSQNENVKELRMYIDGLSTLCGMYPQTAYGALEELCTEMRESQEQQNTTEYDPLIAQAEEILKSTEELKDGGVDIRTMLQTISRETGCAITGDEDSGIMAEGTAEEKSLVLCTLDSYCRQAAPEEEEAIRALLQEFAGLLAAEEENGVFQKLAVEEAESDGGQEKESYAPADKVAAWRSLRYVWNGSHKKAILAQGSRYYRFTAFQELVERERKQEDEMNRPALFQSTVWLPESYIEQEFACKIRELEGTGYAVLVSDEIQMEAEKICSLLY